MKSRCPRIGIIAYGSLVSDPGDEIKRATSELLGGLKTPFPVEFARSSGTRGGGPTLIPHEAGASVSCSLFVLQDGIRLEAARDILFRREWRRGRGDVFGSRRRELIGECRNFGPTEIALFTALESNVTPLSGTRLAELAIASARGDVGARRADGISYLIDVISRGTTTPLIASYTNAVLQQAGAPTLEDAWNNARDG